MRILTSVTFDAVGEIILKEKVVCVWYLRESGGRSSQTKVSSSTKVSIWSREKYSRRPLKLARRSDSFVRLNKEGHDRTRVSELMQLGNGSCNSKPDER